MKKLFLVLVSVLLLAGVAQAVDMDQAITNSLTAQNKGNSTATDSSVYLKVWSPSGSANPGVGVSASTKLVIYSDYPASVGYVLNTSGSALDTIGEVVDYINASFASDSSVNIQAVVGSDARRSSASTQLVPANILATGTRQADSTGLVYSQTNGRVSAGVEGNAGKINRIKSFTCQLPNSVSTSGADGITYTLYDKDTAVWSRYVSGDANRTSSNPSNSTNSVMFPNEKGISVTKGNSIMVEAVGDTLNAGLSTAEKLVVNMSIVYDQLAE